MITFDEKAILARLKIEQAEEAEVDVRLSDLLVANGRETEGDVLLEQAVVLSPQSILVNEALARREVRRNNSTGAARFYRLALGAGSTNTNALIVSATARLEQSMSFGADIEGGGGASTILALEEIHRALQIDPGDLNAWRLLGRAYFVAEKASEAGVTELSQAITDDTNGIYVRYYRGLLLFRLGKTAAALSDLDFVIAGLRTPPPLRTYAINYKLQRQFAEDQAKVEQLVREESYEEARPLIDRGVILATGTSSAKNYQRLHSWVDENEHSAKIVKSYNQNDWAAVVTRVKVFLEEFPRSAFCDEARQLATSAEAFERQAGRAKTQ